MKASGMNALITTTTPFYAAKHWEDAKVVFAVRSLDLEQQMLQKNLQYFDQVIGYLKMFGDDRESNPPAEPTVEIAPRVLTTPTTASMESNGFVLPVPQVQMNIPIQLPPVRMPTVEVPRSFSSKDDCIYMILILVHDYFYPQVSPSLFPLPVNVPDATLSQVCQHLGMLSPSDLEQLLSNPAWQSAVANTLRSFKPN